MNLIWLFDQIYSLEYFSGGDKVDPKKERRGKYLHVRYDILR